MKFVRKSVLPWDLTVILALTTVTFGYSIAQFGRASVNVMEGDESQQTSDAEHGLGGSLAVRDLGCLERKSGTDRLLNEGGKIRFRGRFCNVGRIQMRSFSGIKVSNVSNGYEGTIFMRGRDPYFISDFLVLQKGKNTVRFEWKDPVANAQRSYVAEIFEQ